MRPKNDDQKGPSEVQEDDKKETNEDDAGSSLFSPIDLPSLASATMTDLLSSLAEADAGAATAREISFFSKSTRALSRRFHSLRSWRPWRGRTTSTARLSSASAEGTGALF